MIYEKARAEMTPRDVTFMEDILKKDNVSLLPSERELLIARREYLTDEELARYEIEEKEAEENAKGKGYADLKFNDLKSAAKERGIVLTNSMKAVEIVALLEEYDNLKDGDEFQGKIAHIATQEMIDENELDEELQVGDLFFVEKEAEENAKK